VESLTLNILVEGPTEAAVVKDFLSPYWQARFTKCVVANYDGSGNLKMKYVKDTKRLLAQPDQAVLILLDVKNDPFGVSETASSHVEAYQKLQNILYSGLGLAPSNRLGVFPVVREIETWLLADPAIMNRTISHPENEGNPANLIPRYKKGERAKPFFHRASAEVVYADNCPHFIKMADWLWGKESPKEELEDVFTPEQRNQLDTLMMQHAALAERINQNIKNGHITAAGVLRTDLIYIEQQIKELNTSVY